MGQGRGGGARIPSSDVVLMASHTLVRRWGGAWQKSGFIGYGWYPALRVSADEAEPESSDRPKSSVKRLAASGVEKSAP